MIKVLRTKLMGLARWKQHIQGFGDDGVFRTNILRDIRKISPLTVIGEVPYNPDAYRENRMNAYLTLPNDVSHPSMFFTNCRM